MSIRIKVCGMKHPENIRAVASLNPDYLGIIFYRQSKRFVGEDFDRQKLEGVDKKIKRTGVFVNQSSDYITAKVKSCGLDLIQLHGDEPVEQCRELRESGYKLIKVFQTDTGFDFRIINPYKEFVDYFMFDTKSDSYGGTGRRFDWSLLKRYDNEIPLFLSGGLDEDSAEDILKLRDINIHAADINSKFELEPGIKDPEKVKRFIDSLRK